MEPMSTPTFPEQRPDQSPADALSGALEALGGGTVRSTTVVPLSDLSKPGVSALAGAWPGLPEATRVSAVRRMGELSEDRLDLNFGRALRVALSDPSPVVRQLAVAALWEDDGPDLPDRLLELATSDPSQDVRAEAAQGLARFADRAAADELGPGVRDRVQATLVALVDDPGSPHVVRRRALESVAVFGHDEVVKRLIAGAYDSDEQGLQASALYAMGRNLDARWLDTVLDELHSPEAELRYEAARACGFLENDRAVPGLALLAADPDAEVRYAAIAALGQVGGRSAVRVLRDLAAAAEERDVELLDPALEEALASVDPLQVRV